MGKQKPVLLIYSAYNQAAELSLHRHTAKTLHSVGLSDRLQTVECVAHKEGRLGIL